MNLLLQNTSEYDWDLLPIDRWQQAIHQGIQPQDRHCEQLSYKVYLMPQLRQATKQSNQLKPSCQYIYLLCPTLQYNTIKCMSELGKYIYHKHLVSMECRKDLILENDFTNQRIKEGNVSLVNRYSKKIKNNKMRFCYMFGFAAFFSLGYIYDLIVQSKVYDRTTNYLFDGSIPPALKQLQQTKVNYSSQQAKEIGQYFIKMELRYPKRQITARQFTHRVPELSELGQEPLNVNSFVSACLQKNIKASDLPQLY